MIINKFLIQYLVIGLINTLFGYGLIFALVYIGIMAEISNFIGYFFGVLLSYYLNKKYNFKSTNSHKEDLPKFATSMFISYILNLIVLVICYRFFHINVYISQILAGVVYTGSGYILSKNWVFAKKQ